MGKNFFLIFLSSVFLVFVFLSGCLENNVGSLNMQNISFCEVDPDCVFTDSCQTCIFEEDGCSKEVSEGICTYCCPKSINSTTKEVLLEWEEKNCVDYISCQYAEPFSTESFCNSQGVCELKEYFE